MLGNMKILIDFLPIIGACLSLIISHICYIIGLIKTKNKTKLLELLKSTIESLMTEAEKFTNYTGEEKRAYVFTRVKEFVSTKGLKVKDETIDTVINTLIDFSKKVNAKGGTT